MRFLLFIIFLYFNVSFGQSKNNSAVVKTRIEAKKTSLNDSIKKTDSLPKPTKPKTPLFEGIITYQKKLLNPSPLLISDDEFYQTVENKGVSSVLIFVKGNKYKMISKEYISIFDPVGYRVCTKDLIKEKDTFYCLPANLPEDKVQKTESCDQKAVVLDKNCVCFLVKSPFAVKTIFYNAEELKASTTFWANHHKDDWGSILQRAGAFPLKILTHSSFGNEEWEAIKIDPKTLSISDFEF